MCNCEHFNGDSCDYPDWASGQTEDNYCKFEFETDSNKIDCDNYIEDDNNNISG